MPKNPTLIEPIDTSFNNLTKATVMTSNKVADPKPFDREALRDKTKGIVPKNGQLSLTYISWKAMKARVGKRKYYQSISICDKWSNSFESFLEDMGERPSNMTLDRVDNRKGYSKDNCRWATAEQQSNNKRNTLYLEYGGISKSLKDWCNQFGIEYRKAWDRINKQEWNFERTFEINNNTNINFK
jgi:hypothetical protein